MDGDFKRNLTFASLILVVLISIVIIAAPVFATTAKPPDNYVSVQQGGVFLLRGSITFDQAAIGSFSWGPVGWYHYGDPTENFCLENTPSVYWSDNTPVENVSISEEETANAHSITIADNGDGIARNGTFYINIWLRAASGDGTPHKAENQWIYFAMDLIVLFEPSPVFVTAPPIYVDVTEKPIRGVDVSISPDNQSGVPCTTLNYTVTVKNTGNMGGDNYNLTVRDTENWGPTLDNYQFKNIPENENLTTTLHVHVPVNAIGCTNDIITVTATSQGDNTKSDNASCIAHATIVRGVEVSISPSYRSGPEGATLNYVVTIVNTGNVTDSYTLSASDTENWGPGLSENQFDSVPPFENDERETTLSVTIPDNAVPCTEDTITVTATSKENGMVSAENSCIAHVAIRAGVEVSISPSYDNGLPGENLIYEVRVTNTGNAKDNYNLIVSDSADPSWNPRLSENRLDDVQPGENRATILSVIVPSDVAACTVDNIRVTATSMENEEVENSENCQAHALPFRCVEVSISPGYQSAVPGSTLEYTVTVKNTGNVEDNYILALKDNENWTPALDNAWLVVPRIDNRTTTLRVTVPENTPACTEDNITVTATSKENENVNAENSCIAHAALPVGVEVSISPDYDEGPLGTALNYIVTVKNVGGLEDNYYLTVSDNLGWPLGLSENLLTNIPPDGSENVTLTVTILENAVPCAEDNITVTATSQTDNTIENSASCIAHALGIKKEIRTSIYSSADIYAFGEYAEGYSRSQLKFDISGIPRDSDIISAKLWMYRLAVDNWDGNVALYRVDDQPWGENITAGEFDNQTLTNGQNHAGKFMSHGWGDLDVLTQLNVDYDAAHTYTSFRLRWINDNENEPSIGVDDGRFLVINGEAEELSIIFCASEYNGRDPYLEVTYVPPYAVSTSISPTYRSGSPGENVTFLVTVTNTGNLDDNYSLEVSDNAGWDPSVLPTVISVASGSSGEATLTVTIPENDPSTSDNITVTATSMTDNTVSSSDWCIALRAKVGLRFVTIYKVGLDLVSYLENGSKLVVKFYRYDNIFQAENVIDEFVPPYYIVIENENVSHPRRAEGFPWGTVQIARLVLTTDNTAEVISTIASLTVHKSDLKSRYIEILGLWFPHPELHDAFKAEVRDILSQWFPAPP